MLCEVNEGSQPDDRDNYKRIKNSVDYLSIYESNRIFGKNELILLSGNFEFNRIIGKNELILLSGNFEFNRIVGKNELILLSGNFE